VFLGAGIALLKRDVVLGENTEKICRQYEDVFAVAIGKAAEKQRKESDPDRRRSLSGGATFVNAGIATAAARQCDPGMAGGPSRCSTGVRTVRMARRQGRP